MKKKKQIFSIRKLKGGLTASVAIATLFSVLGVTQVSADENVASTNSANDVVRASDPLVAEQTVTDGVNVSNQSTIAQDQDGVSYQAASEEGSSLAVVENGESNPTTSNLSEEVATSTDHTDDLSQTEFVAEPSETVETAKADESVNKESAQATNAAQTDGVANGESVQASSASEANKLANEESDQTSGATDTADLKLMKSVSSSDSSTIAEAAIPATFDKTVYHSGENVTLSVEVPSDSEKTTVSVHHLADLVYQTSLTKSGDLVLPSSIFEKNAGYTVNLLALDNNSKQVGSTTLGLSIEDDWTVYPRYGVVAGSTDASFSMTNDQLEGYKRSIDKLNQMHINNFFFYDVYDTTANPFPSNVESFNQEWASWTTPKIETELVKNLVKYIQANGGKTMLYNMLNARSTTNGVAEEVPDYTKTATLYNAQDNNDFGRTDELTHTTVQQFVDSNDPNWQNFIIGTMLKAIKEGGFDGWQADTMGDASVYKISPDGSKTEHFQMAKGYASLSKAAAAVLKDHGYYYVINDINTGRADDLADTGITVPYSEIWPLSGDDTYSALKRLVDRQKDLTGQSPIFAIYTENRLNNKTINKNSELLVDAVVAASGGYHMTVAALNSSNDSEHFGILQNEYYPNQDWPVTSEMSKAVFNYQQFIVAYEELLRGEGLHEVSQTASIKDTKGELIASADGEANKVYTFSKETSKGDQVVHLINLKNADNKWNNNTNNPETLQNIKVSIPLKQGVTKKQATNARVYLASPDGQDISLSKLDVERQLTGDESYQLSVTIPDLKIWNMLYVTNLVEKDTSEEVVPTDPEEPAIPTEPAQPTAPEEPAPPTEPAQPADPEEPAPPTEPVQPAAPEEPATPTVPAQPADPEEPASPTEPAQPADPEDQSIPTTPEQPVVTEQPVNSVVKQSKSATVNSLLPTTGEKTTKGLVIAAGLVGIALMGALVLSKSRRKDS